MNKYRFDELFDGFLKDFGEPHCCEPITEDTITEYCQKLPEQLFVYWREIGSCGFHNGLLWMVNPSLYQSILDSWLEGSPFENRNGLSVIARSAFGLLYIWEKGKGNVMTINPNNNVITLAAETDVKSLSLDDENQEMRIYWGFEDPEYIDETDINETPLFSRALKKLGQLKSDEMYGFSHRLTLGGKETLENLEIVKLDVYHDLAQQMEPPKIIKI
jgi:hypothetical protein